MNDIKYRRLMSTIANAQHAWGSTESEQYVAAIDAGKKLRCSWTPPGPLGDQQPDEIYVIAYTDPLDPGPRYAIHDVSSAESDIVDCATQAEAEALYEQWIRAAAECGNIYAHCDVDGVPTEKPTDPAEEY